jgi:two-component system sensor histidine kinase ResE
LVDNGIKYNAQGGSVTVTLVSAGNNAEIKITDTGAGIAETDMPKLFQKFYRGESTMKKVTEGTGLGLYLAKNIIEGHKGTIRVESAEGRGTTFFITIPLVV